MLFIAVLRGDLKLLYRIIFFSAQLMSAQRLSSLFPLRKFFSDANLIFKCFALHVCLESTFIKTKNFGRTIFFNIFRVFSISHVFKSNERSEDSYIGHDDF